MREIHSVQELTSVLQSENSLKDTVLQSIDVTEISDLVLEATVENTLFLGCVLPDDVVCSVIKRGASVFPKLTGLPFNPYAPAIVKRPTPKCINIGLILADPIQRPLWTRSPDGYMTCR